MATWRVSARFTTSGGLVGKGGKWDNFQSYCIRKDALLGKHPQRNEKMSPLLSSPPASLLCIGGNQNGTYMLITLGREETCLSVHFSTKWFSPSEVIFSPYCYESLRPLWKQPRQSHPSTYYLLTKVCLLMPTYVFGPNTKSFLSRDYQETNKSDKSKSKISYYIHALCFTFQKGCSPLSHLNLSIPWL